jgi:ectoine hydroxylase-related dioxygenase (phytanoyl-CoA dioxygenase family)
MHHYNLEKNGYVIVKSFYAQDQIDQIIDEIDRVGKFIYGDFSAQRIPEDQPSKQQRLYRVLRYMASLRVFSCLEKNLKLCLELGLSHPAIMSSCNVRMDTPLNKNLFHWHQDITYLLGSLNGLTFWVPLADTNQETGSIEIIPGSHNKGIYPFDIKNKHVDAKTIFSPRDLTLKNEPGAGIIVEAEKGDLVVFRQTLLHRSTANYSKNTRWTVQLRFADLLSEQFCDDDYPFGDATNIKFTNYMAFINHDQK